MKLLKFVVFPLLCVMAGIITKAQERTLEIYSGGTVLHAIPIARIDSIKIDKILSPPSMLTAVLSDNGVVLTWNAVAGATSYEIFRSSDNITYTSIATDVVGSIYTDVNPLTGINYYKVSAKGYGLTSSMSAASAPVSFGGSSTIIETGLYMGIIGFNQELKTKTVSILAPNTKGAFTGFVTNMSIKNGTLLYYAVDNAIDKLLSTTLPNDLVNVSIVTFTDGLDQGSVMMNSEYMSDIEYLAALNNRIETVTIQGLPITAYSIGLKGTDVTDEAQFMANLESLASTPENAAEVSSMEEVNAKFQEIADQLYNSSTSQTVRLMIPGQSNGTVVRFTFDNVSDASQSTMYIEGTFSLQDCSLKNIKYEGLTCNSGQSVIGTQDGIFVTFSFTDLRQVSGESIPTTHIKQWNYISATSQWQINSEFTPEDNTITTVERKSAVIMLVLDCSSSLGSQFIDMQTHACQFIEKMAENTEISTGGGIGNNNDVEIDLITELSYDELVLVEGGTFLMGAQNVYEPEYDWQGVQSGRSLNYDKEAQDIEAPVHEVSLSSYYIGRYEVTQQLWEYVMNYEGTTPDGTTLIAVNNGPWLGNSLEKPFSPYGMGDTYPAYFVSYDDIIDYFLPRLNKITGRTFRLPTEAEWEYAARGGQKDEYTRTHISMSPSVLSSSIYYCYAGGNNADDVAWSNENSNVKTHPVGQKKSNSLGLYDMSGNVEEWCSDWYDVYSSSSQINPHGPISGTYKVRRGGNYQSSLSGVRVSYRRSTSANNRFSYLGFRLACSVE